MDYKDKSHHNSMDRTDGTGLTSTDPHVAGESIGWVPELRIAPRLPAAFNPQQPLQFQLPGALRLEFINNTNMRGTGCAQHSHTRVTGHRSVCDWLGTLPLQLDTDQHITNLSDPRGNNLSILSHLTAQAVSIKTMSSTL